MDLPPRPSDHLADWERDALQQALHRFLKGNTRLGIHSVDDLEQELVIHWWSQQHRYQQAGSATRRTYMVRVIENKLRDLGREQQAQLRGGHATTLPLEGTDEDDLPFLERLADSEAGPEQWAIGHERDNAVTNWMRSLPGRDQETVRAIYEAPSIQAAADRLRIKRSSVYDRMQRLRRLARDEGLDEFLQ